MGNANVGKQQFSHAESVMFREAVSGQKTMVLHRERAIVILPLRLMRGGAVWQLVGLITRRSQVRILPPLPNIYLRVRQGPFLYRRFVIGESLRRLDGVMN